MNIIKNAMEAISQARRIQGEIVIQNEVCDNHVIIHIKDNGCGIDSEAINHIFSPYYSTKPTGTGLGMVICEKIVKEYDGEISLESEVGVGTIFRIKLPLICH